MDRLFNQEVEIYRVNTPTPQNNNNNNNYNNPFALNSASYVKDEYVSTIKAKIARKGSSLTLVNDVNSYSVGKMRLYANINEDIRMGDRIKDVSENLNYTVSYVYKPNLHHIEAELEIIRKEY
jgi:hypothetical protein